MQIRHLHRLAAALSLVLAVVSPVTGAGVRAAGFGEDDRIERPREKGTPYGAIGLLIRSNGLEVEAGTAFLISPCHVLTAYHVAAGKEKLTADQVSTFFIGDGDIGPGYSGSAHYAASTAAHPIAWGKYLDSESDSMVMRARAVSRNGWEDWAVLKLDTCFGDASHGYGYLRLKPMATRDLAQRGETPAAIEIGLPMDRSEATLTEDPHCRLIGQVYDSGWQGDCRAIPGNSGGPVLEAPADGRQIAAGDPAGWPRVLGITVSGTLIAGIDRETSDATTLSADDPNYFALLSTAVPVSAFYSRIASLLPPDPEIDRALAASAGDGGYGPEDTELAITDLGQAIERQRKVPELYMRRGIWQSAANHTDAAIADFTSALALDPAYPAALLMRSQALAVRNDAGRGDLDTAIRDLDRLLERFADSPELRLQRGQILNRAHRFEEAVVDLTAVLKDRPSSAAAATERGQAQAELDHNDAAQGDFDLAVKFEPEMPAVYVARGQFLARIGEEDAALADYDRAIKIYPREAEAYTGRGHVLLQQGDIDAALESFDRAIRFDDTSAYVLSGRASVHQADGDYAAAVRDYRRAVDLDPGEPFTHLLLYVAQRRAGTDAAAAQAALRSFAGDPRFEAWPRSIARYFLGEIDAAALTRAADQGDAFERRNQAFDRDFYLGQAAALAGDAAEARRRFAAVVATGARQYLEFNIAAAEIGALGKLDAVAGGKVPGTAGPSGEVSATTHPPAPPKKNEK